jgi:hypothetical protein
MKKGNKILYLFVLAVMQLCYTVSAQQIAIDKGVRVEGIWCFPLITDPSQYLFLPDRSVLSLNEKNQPQFSFVQYVNPADTGKSAISTITKASGGGVLHFLVLYDTDEKKISRAQAKLKELLNNDSAKLRGPIIFKEGRYALVSSIVNPETGQTERKLMSVGAAPVLQGSRIALSFELDATRATLLMESFKTTTPDISIIFDLTFSGIMDAYNAKMTVDWTEVQKYEKIGGGATVYFVSAELEKIYESLRRTGAIKLETIGQDDKMQVIVDEAYKKVTDMMFQRVEPEQAPAAQNGLGEMLSGLVGNSGGGAASSGSSFGFGAHFAYKRKDQNFSGKTVLDFNSRSATERHHYVTFNIGDFYKKYGQDEGYFRTVSLYQPELEMRNINVTVDGEIYKEFDKMINSVSVTLRKKHQNGSQTFREVNIQKATVQQNKPVVMSYGSVGDKDKAEWFKYEYKAQYNFVGGRNYQTEWKENDYPAINLFVPYSRKQITLEADWDAIKANNVRAISVKVSYPFLGEVKTADITVRPGDDLSKKYFDVTLPNGQYEYEYTIRWRMKDNTEKVATGKTEVDFLVLDAIPGK